MIIIATQNFPPDRGGIEVLMGGLADNLSAAGETIAVYGDRIRTAGLNERGSLTYPVHRVGGIRPLRRRAKARAIAQAVRNRGITGIFADSYKSIELLPEVGVPIVVLAHGMEFPAQPSAYKRWRIKRTLARAQAIVANSAYTASLVRPYLADGERRLSVINPPIGEQRMPSDEAAAAARTMIAGRSPVLLSLARLEPRKGVDMVIRALPALLKSHPRAVFLVAGGGVDRTRLEQVARESGVLDHVTFVGAVDADAKAALFAAADLFVMPTRREGNSVEGYGIVYAEAAWYGVPAIAGREGGAADAVLDGETGLLCNASDLGDVERTVARLVSDADLRKRLGETAAQRARGELQWSAAVPRFLNALRGPRTD